MSEPLTPAEIFESIDAAQAVQYLRQVAALPELKLSQFDHACVSQSINVLEAIAVAAHEAEHAAATPNRATRRAAAKKRPPAKKPAPRKRARAA